MGLGEVLREFELRPGQAPVPWGLCPAVVSVGTSRLEACGAGRSSQPDSISAHLRGGRRLAVPRSAYLLPKP